MSGDLTSNTVFSPKRYFLDAPKEQPGTCFVKNDDYADLWQAHERLQEGVSRYESGRVVLSGMVDDLKLKLQQVTLERDAMLEDIAALRMAERLNVETVAKLQRSRDALEADLKRFVAHAARGVQPPNASQYVVPHVVMDTVYETLKFYANQCSYEGERTGGVLAGCPRGPTPTPQQLIPWAQRALAMIDSVVLGRDAVTKSEPYCEACMGMHSPDDPAYHPELRAAGETKDCLCKNITINTPMGIPCPDCGRAL